MLNAFLIALQFLTRLPLPQNISRDLHADPQTLARSVLTYPLVGALIGFILVVILFLLDWLFPYTRPLVSAGIILLAWVLITGALHLDGLSDSADAWVGGYGDRERSLAIMKDPYCGPAGVSVIVVVLLAKYAALTTVITQNEAYLLVIPAMARAAIILLFLTTPYVRKGGIGASHAEHLSPRGAYTALALTAVVCFFLLGFKFIWLLAVLAAVFLLLRYLMLQRIGGTTGDTAGAMVEVLELGGLLALAII